MQSIQFQCNLCLIFKFILTFTSVHLWLKKPICATTRTTPSLPGDLRGSPLTAKSARPGHSHVLQLFRHLQEKQHRPPVVVEIRDGQHPIHTCQRFQRTTAAIYQQRADLKRWGWWGGYFHSNLFMIKTLTRFLSHVRV